MIATVSPYIISVSAECLKCVADQSDFRFFQMRMAAIFGLAILHMICRGCRIQAFPTSDSLLKILIFWGVSILTVAMFFKALTTELLSKIIGADGVFALGLGAVIMSVIASLNDQEILTDFASLIPGRRPPGRS